MSKKPRVSLEPFKNDPYCVYTEVKMPARNGQYTTYTASYLYGEDAQPLGVLQHCRGGVRQLNLAGPRARAYMALITPMVSNYRATLDK